MYHITALVFSGRRNPSWEVDADRLKEAFDAFEQAAVSTDHSPAASLLGYNGLQVERGNKLWQVTHGRIFYKVSDETVLVKTDKNGLFEKKLLQTAPAEIKKMLDALR